MARRVVMGDLRVQQIQRSDGRRSWTIVWPEGTEHREADRFLRVHEGSGHPTDLRVSAGRSPALAGTRVPDPRAESRLRDLERYMGMLGAEVRMPLGEPWRVGKRPYGRCGTVDYGGLPEGLLPASGGCSASTSSSARALDRHRLPSRADRRRSFLGHATTAMPANPLAPQGPRRRHPKMLPDGARERLLATVRSARDRMVVTWLGDGGLRIGELCGLHLVDLHLREDAACGQCRTPHLHVCHRPDNPNRAEAKTKHPWRVEDGIVTGGLIKRVSPAMIHTYFDYITTEYPRGTTDHGMLLVQLHGDQRGAAVGAGRGTRMLGRAGQARRAGSGPTPRVSASFTSAVLDASGGNLVIARDAGGWASAAMVDEVYGHVDVHDPVFDAALRTVWGESVIDVQRLPPALVQSDDRESPGPAGDPDRADRRALVRPAVSRPT